MKIFIALVFAIVPLGAVPADTAQYISIPSPSTHNSTDLRDVLFSVETLNSRGSAFLLQEENGVWLISNGHVFENGKSYNIQNSNGELIKIPEIVQVASDRDLIRFKTTQTNGLIAAESCEYGQKIYAFGDSGGIGALARLDGTVLAIGADQIEISADIISGNSGGPVVNEKYEVVGVSTYLLNPKNLPYWMIEDTRFGKTRRMALKIDRVNWIEMPISDYNRETAWLKKVENGVEAFDKIMSSLSKTGPRRKITSDYDNRQVQKWLKKHNRLAEDIQEAEAHVYYNHGSARDENHSLNRKWKSNLKSLRTLIRGFERDAGSLNHVTIPYFEERMKQLEFFYQHHLEDLETMLESI